MGDRAQYWRHKLDPVAWAMDELRQPLRDKGVERFYPWQEAVLRAPQGAQQIFLIHRQGGKSMIAAIKCLHAAIFHTRGKGPILITSPTQRQSGLLFDTIKDLIRDLSDPPGMDEDNKLSCRLTNGARIISLHGEERTVRGYSNVALLIEDEASRVKDELFMATEPMLIRSGGGRILMSTPYGKSGHFFREYMNVEADGSQRPDDLNIWQKITFTVEENPDMNTPEKLAFLARAKAMMGRRGYAQEFLCEFVETEDALFSYEDIMAAMSGEVRPLFGPGEEL